MLLQVVQALEYRPASGEIRHLALRDSVAHYHNYSLDHLWSGTDSWAVKFNFEQYYATISGLNFSATGALVFIPNSSISDDMTIRICTDLVNQPDLSPEGVLFESTLSQSNMILNDWNIIYFDEPIISEFLWLVIDFPTNPVSQFIAASATGGQHSYFSNNGFYQSMYEYSYQSEFLFSLFGAFITSGADLDLLSFFYNGSITASGQIYPQITVRNPSASTAPNPYLVFSVQHPQGILHLQEQFSGIVRDTLFLPDILPGEIITVDYTDSLYFRLLDNPAQYRSQALITFEGEELIHNNTKNFDFDSFNIQFRPVVIENMLSINSYLSSNLLSAQQSIIDPANSLIINYFPNQNELPFYCLGSLNRFNYYDLMGLPNTIINGSRKMVGYQSSSYSNQFSTFYAEAEMDSTFLSNFDLNGTVNDLGDIQLTVNISNEEASLFISFINNCRLYFLVLENVYSSLPGEFAKPVLRQIPCFFSGLTIGAGNTYSQTCEFNYLEDISLIGTDESELFFVAMIQNNNTKKIYGLEQLTFDELQYTSSVEPNLNNSVSAKLFPNPYRLRGNLKMEFNLNQSFSKADLRIYNIKGQLVRSLNKSQNSSHFVFEWNGCDEEGKTAASGVYLLRFAAENHDSSAIHTRKFIVIR
jgi:hypothetical protein